MGNSLEIFMAYASAFEETYRDDDWSRLAPYFAQDATYEVRGGPMACRIEGRDAIFAGIRKSLDGLDRRSDERRIEVTEGPVIEPTAQGEELRIGWRVSYRFGDAPPTAFDGRSVVRVADGLIRELVDEYDEQAIRPFTDWLGRYRETLGLDGAYV